MSGDQHTDAATQALSRFKSSAEDFLKYQHIYAEAVGTKLALQKKKIEIEEKDDKIQELETAIAVFTHGGNKEISRMKLETVELKKDISDVTRQLQLVAEEKRRTETGMNDTKQLLTKQAKDLAQLQKEVMALKKKEKTMTADLEKEIGVKKDAICRLTDVHAQLNVYVGYTTNLVDLNRSKFSKAIARIWECTNSLVKKYFSPDLTDEILEEHDLWVQQAWSVLRPPSAIMIPPTNSPAAKLARQAVMLNVLAHVLSKYIFTAAPPPLGQAGLDDIMSKLVDEDANKELLFRALLISGSAGSPPHDKEIQTIAKWILDVIGSLLITNSRTEMKNDLRNYLGEAANCWIEARRSRDKVLASMECESYPNSWKRYSVPSYWYKQNTKHSQVSDPENEDEVAFIAFPAIILIGKDKEETIHHGILIHYDHMRKAEEEWRLEQKKRRFSRSGVPRNIIGPPTF